MKMIWSGFKISFSMYSKIPMPKTEWNEANMKYSMCFFPLIGAVIGVLLFGWYCLCDYLGFGTILRLAGTLVLPILITGGIHLDGFIDTQDALSSYQPKERKLEILKDSHIGAFALISSIVYFIVLGGVWSELAKEAVFVLCFGFILSRALSGFAVVTFELAKDSGLAHAFSDSAQKRAVRIVMLLFAISSGAAMVAIGGAIGVSALMFAILSFHFYRVKAYKEFGGITGDLAGWFLQLCELAMAVGTLVGQSFIGR
ncbi:adenosylcobinamide-GDP ribazoletransferase [Konateibacter massiliensis]|uniref:adenosylcobinamide-GDP ribazoletransferase n=1 Tax=Konateibacter massiliensis TaxID=2002841 RepID=UPI000C15A25B|nr:adenosylcobinamide-GDP ribazoletransferase [Konateibacter massiliensis]